MAPSNIMFASPTRIDQAIEMITPSSSVAGSMVVTNFSEVLQNDANSIFVGGRRVSGVRRTRYSYSQHFQAWNKVLRSIIHIAKLFAFIVPYLIVKHADVTHQADLRRQKWTCNILWFYNTTFFVAICLFLAFRVTKNEKLAALLFICLSCTVIYFFTHSVYFMYWGVFLYEDLPESESQKMPESVLVYVIYLLCFIANLICVFALLYLLCYLALMTYQMRGVLFADYDGHLQSEQRNLRIIKQSSNMRRLEKLRQHKKPIVSRLFMRCDSNCTVCMSEFEETDDIVELECHKSHIYHFDCIESWITRGNRECPICRQVILFHD